MNDRNYLRRTVVVHTTLAGHTARVAAARAGENGVQIMTMGQMAARLAGGLLRPIDPDVLRDAIRDALPAVSLGELEPIKDLPGMVRAALTTLDKVWRAGIDLSVERHPRLKALHALESEVLRRLPPAMKRPKELVDLACGRLAHAKAAIGPIEIQGHSEMSPCWRPLLTKLAETVPVSWNAGSRHVPTWLSKTRVEVLTEVPNQPSEVLSSCAHPQHEVLEAFRWIRKLLANGTRPDEIALTAASTSDLDDYILALSRDSNVAVHFVHGVKALASRDGQTAAALAEVTVKGISQERIRRLFNLLPDKTPSIRDLPRDWMRVLPMDAPLTALERWERVFAKLTAADWPDGIDHSATVLEGLRLLAKGPNAATEIGETLLRGMALSLWRRALNDGPATALPVTLTQMRNDDTLEPASHVIWGSAIALASAPRPHVWMLALNAGRWPRRISEDRLIPDHVLSIDQLDPLPIADGDKRDFATIRAAAKSVAMSFSRRDVEGRLIGRSPLAATFEPQYLSRARVPDHAASESDRILARPVEFKSTPAAASAILCWRNWYRPEITAHDGLIGRPHPRLAKVFAQPMSATSLKLLLRDPIRFMWRYALGWRQPEDAEEPLTVDGLGFGNLVHGLLQIAVDSLELSGGLAKANAVKLDRAIEKALETTVASWESEQPVPPGIIWRNTIDRVRRTSAAALNYPLDAFTGQSSWTELPFGSGTDAGQRTLPWKTGQAVHIPGTGIQIRGHIDRLDMSSDKKRARVIDYKTGKLNKKMAEVAIKGGGELQRCLYAFAVQTLVGQKIEIEAALLYPAAPDGEQSLFPLQNLGIVLAQLTTAINLSREAMVSGIAVPGTDAADMFNDFAFALPANPSYLPKKLPLAQERLGQAADIWDAP